VTCPTTRTAPSWVESWGGPGKRVCFRALLETLGVSIPSADAGKTTASTASPASGAASPVRGATGFVPREWDRHAGGRRKKRGSPIGVSGPNHRGGRPSNEEPSSAEGGTERV